MELFHRRLKHLISCCFIIVVMGLGLNSCTNQKNTMDIQLAELISEQLKINDRDLKQSDLSLLTTLEIKDVEIKTLVGLRDCINLEKLVLQNCALSDISEIKYLTSLKYLNIALNPKVNDITSVGYLSNLEVFIASGIIVTDISPLKNNTKLKRLYLNNAKNIMDINPLSELTELNVLEFYDNQVSDLKPLSKLVNLERLWCNRNNISDISPILFLSKLKYLIISNNLIHDLEPLSGLNSLTVLDFSNNKVSDISVFNNLLKHGAFTDTSYEIWWVNDIDNSPFINMKGNLINFDDDAESIEVAKMIRKKGIALIQNAN